MYYKTGGRKCTYDKIPKMRLHLWEGNSYNNYIMMRKESVIIMFFMMGITDGRKQLDFTQTVICGVCGKYGRYQVFHDLYGIVIIFYPMLQMEPALLRADELLQYACTSWIRKWERPSRAGSRLEILPQHLTLVNQGSRGSRIPALQLTAGMRQQKILSFVRSVAIGFHVIDRGDGG